MGNNSLPQPIAPDSVQEQHIVTDPTTSESTIDDEADSSKIRDCLSSSSRQKGEDTSKCTSADANGTCSGSENNADSGHFQRRYSPTNTNTNTNTNANTNLNNGMIVTMEGNEISHSGSDGDVNSPTTFTKADAEALFAKFCGMEPDRAGTFASQHLVILMVDLEGGRGTMKVDYKSLYNASKAVAIQRNPDGQIYFALQLNAFAHLSLGPTLYEELTNVLTVETIPNHKNHKSEYLCVWNRDDNESRFVADTSALIRAMIPSISKVMTEPSADDSRGTIAINLGISTSDCGQYRNNRSTIFGNIKPFFIKNKNIEEEGKTLLGRLVVYVCKNILPVMNHGNHFKLGCSDINTPGGREREKLRREFGKRLNVGESDLPFFLVEGISVLFPTVLHPHKDVKNDWHPNFNGSICINCTVPLSSITDEAIREFLIKIGYSDSVWVPCCIVLYSRVVCRDYFNFRNALSNLEQNQNRNQAVIKVVVNAMLNIRGNRDYIGNIFDASNAMRELEKNLQSSDQDFVAVPSAYDPMSRLSILLDYAFEYHCCVEDLDARGALEYILFIILQQKVEILTMAKIMKCILSRDTAVAPPASPPKNNGSGLYHRMTLVAKHLNVLTHVEMNGHDLASNLEQLLIWCDDTRIAIHGYDQREKGSDSTVDDACRALLARITQPGEDGICGFDIDVEKGKLFIKLASLLGLIPLWCMTWATITSAEDSLSTALGQFDGLSEVDHQQEEFDSLVAYIRKDISKQATGPIIESIICNHVASAGIRSSGGEKLAEDFYFIHSHGDQNKIKLQNFYRIRFEKDWELQILRNGTKSQTLTGWKNRRESLCWKLHDGEITLDSKLMMRNVVRKYFTRGSDPLPPRKRKRKLSLPPGSRVNIIIEAENKLYMATIIRHSQKKDGSRGYTIHYDGNKNPHRNIIDPGMIYSLLDE